MIEEKKVAEAKPVNKGGRPKGSKNKKKKREPVDHPKKLCASCQKMKRIDTNFYMTQDPRMADGRIVFCKECIRKMAINASNEVDDMKFKDMLRSIDRPFDYSIYKASLEEAIHTGKDFIGMYMKNINLTAYKHLTWKDSSFDDKIDVVGRKEKALPSQDEGKRIEMTAEKIKELQMKWGTDYTTSQYYRMEEYHNKLIQFNNIETPQEEDQIIKVVRMSILMDQYLESGKITDYQKLAQTYSNYMKDLKLRTADKTEFDKTGGIRSFSQIYSEVEKDDFIPPWEHYRKIKGIKQDIVDKTIMYMLNFNLKLNKMSKLIEPPHDTPLLDSDEVDNEHEMIIENIEAIMVDDDEFIDGEDDENVIL